MNNEVAEIAKATQEVAKATRTGIEAAQGFGSFVARVLGEPIETAVGLVSDKLKFVRFERQMRLANRYSEVMAQRGLRSEEQPVPPKIALPAIENASLEEDDELPRIIKGEPDDGPHKDLTDTSRSQILHWSRASLY